MQHDADILIIGGGLAGLTAGIHLARNKLRVLLVEKQSYPHHKVCGEYISNEVLPYFEHLGITIDELKPSRIHRFLLSTVSGSAIESQLPLGGFGVSRYTLDSFLAQKARQAGVTMVQDEVMDCTFENDFFTTSTTRQKNYTSRFVIGAYGKRSGIDKRLQRKFLTAESPWLAVKAHYQADYPADLVSLHTFEGGYCGVSTVEDAIVNVCYLVHYKSFKRYKQIEQFQDNVLRKNSFLNGFLARATLLYDKPLAISQVSFAKKMPVENHIFMCGDTAGLIHPLCGNGMAMAIHSAKLISEQIVTVYESRVTSRYELEKQYTLAWNQEFKMRLGAGRLLQSIFQHPLLMPVVMQTLIRTPALVREIIKQTHGRPLVVD
ncbi:NAD(P)/FAD-dependent oxidoreductase [Spirosoma areae]